MSAPGLDPAYDRYEAIFGDLEAPFAFCDLDAVWSNADEMLAARRRQADPGRVEVGALPRRCCSRILARDPGFRGC